MEILGLLPVANLYKKDIFFYWYRAIRDHEIAFGRRIENNRDRFGHVKSFKIVFIHKGTFRYHMLKLVSEEIYTKITFKTDKTGSKAHLLVTEEKPAVITYKDSQLTIKINYEVKNKYGVLCSF